MENENPWRGVFCDYPPQEPGLYEVKWSRVDPDGDTTTIIGYAHWNGEAWGIDGVRFWRDPCQSEVVCWREIQDGHPDDPGPVGPIASEHGTPGEEAVKHDTDKLRMDLIPPEAVTALAEVLAYGAKKYGDRNWEKGIRYSRVFAAVQRHLWAWWRGEDVDEESKLGHLQHALCGLAFLVTYEELGMIHMDDRE